VDESEIGDVAVGQTAHVRVESFRGRDFPARVRKIAPQGSEKDKVVNFEVEVDIIGDASGLRPFMTADAEILVAEAADALVVPEAVVVREDGGTWVDVATGGSPRTRRVAVTLGVGNGSEIAVAEGLAEGDLVVGP
jgi:HlyD family secretion protein